MQINIVPSRKSRQSLSSNNVTILHEYMFMSLKNLHVHILQMNSTIQTYSEMVSWLVNFYMALNAITVQKAVKLWAMMQAVHYPLLFIHGLNSMNFVWVPQRDGYYNSYFIFLAVMVLIVLTGLTCFKIKKWI
jgi:Mg2+ and Co2+ transporter CorA